MCQSGSVIDHSNRKGRHHVDAKTSHERLAVQARADWVADGWNCADIQRVTAGRGEKPGAPATIVAHGRPPLTSDHLTPSRLRRNASGERRGPGW